MGKRRGVVLLGTIIVVMSGLESPAGAQDVDSKALAGGVVLLAALGFAVFVVFAIIFQFKVRRTQLRNVGQVDRSLQMSEESLKLARERTALQAETNRLLRELIEKARQV